MARDISAVGAKITFKEGVLNNLVISEFSEEGTPFNSPDVTVSTNAKNLNGEMISSRTPSVYPFSVTVLAGSVADKKLTQALKNASIEVGNKDQSSSVEWYTCTVALPEIASTGDAVSDDSGKLANTSVTFANCRIKGGPVGPTASASGRLGARTYSFEAESFKIN